MTEHRIPTVSKWASPKFMIVLVIFVLISILVEYGVYTITGIDVKDSILVLVQPNIGISLYFHILPLAVVASLTASFVHMTSYIERLASGVTSRVYERENRRSRRSKRLQFQSIQRIQRRLKKTLRSVKIKMLKAPGISYLVEKMKLLKPLLKSGILVISTFFTISLLLTLAAYPKLLLTATTSFYKSNTIFLNFVVMTIQASENIGAILGPIGAIGSSIQQALIAASLGFHSTIDAAASALTEGFVNLGSNEKYLIVQNVPSWIVASTALFMGRLAKTRYRRKR